MATILTLKRRIKTAQNVSKTTRAMQMIASSRLRRAQEKALASRPYVEKLNQIAQGLMKNIDKSETHQYLKKTKEPKKTLVIVVSPDRGLCGSLISNLLSQVPQDNNFSFVSIGKKGESNLAWLGKKIIASFPFGNSIPEQNVVFPIIKIIDEQFLNGEVDEVKILFTHFTSVFAQTPQFTTLLPVELPKDQEIKNDFILLEPSAEELLPSLLKHYIEMRLHQILLENYASEQAARTIAMKNATDNARDLIEDLQLEYNKSRQEKITNEILDIGGASIALAYE
jgi:F-type H+-transporting ATPase subunit gamma